MHILIYINIFLFFYFLVFEIQQKKTRDLFKFFVLQTLLFTNYLQSLKNNNKKIYVRNFKLYYYYTLIGKYCQNIKIMNQLIKKKVFFLSDTKKKKERRVK